MVILSHDKLWIQTLTFEFFLKIVFRRLLLFTVSRGWMLLHGVPLHVRYELFIILTVYIGEVHWKIIFIGLVGPSWLGCSVEIWLVCGLERLLVRVRMRLVVPVIILLSYILEHLVVLALLFRFLLMRIPLLMVKVVFLGEGLACSPPLGSFVPLDCLVTGKSAQFLTLLGKSHTIAETFHRMVHSLFQVVHSLWRHNTFLINILDQYVGQFFGFDRELELKEVQLGQIHVEKQLFQMVHIINY